MSHTPGPWRVNYGNAVGGGNYLNVTTVPHAPATPARVKFFEMPFGNKATEEDLANAHLIAAAPDLIAVAAAIWEDCDPELWNELQSIDDGQRINVSICAVDLKQLHAAIKKVKGN